MYCLTKLIVFSEKKQGAQSSQSGNGYVLRNADWVTIPTYSFSIYHRHAGPGFDMFLAHYHHFFTVTHVRWYRRRWLVEYQGCNFHLLLITDLINR